MALHATWAGEGQFAPPRWYLHATWGNVRRIAPVGIAPPPVPAVHRVRYAGADAGYEGARWRLDASWYGALPYAPAAWYVNASWGTTQTIGARGIAPPPVPAVHRVRYAGADAGYEGARWRLDASWYGAEEYQPPRWTVFATWFAPPDAKVIGAIGFDAAEVGTPALPVVQAVGWRSSRFGQAEIYNNARLLQPAGIGSSAAFGWHHAYNNTAYIAATGIRSGVAFGLQEVWHRQRWVTPEGIAPRTRWGGGTFVSHFLRYVDVAGKGISGASYGKPWVSHSPRVLDVDGRGIAPGFVGVPALGGEQGIFPVGWLDERFGARIVPPEQILDVVGWRDLQWGENVVWNHTQYIAPAGYAPWRDAPHLRWGYGKVWNLRQYIVTDSESASTGLSPPETQVSARAVVKNRNRTIAPWGDMLGKFGYTHVWLKGMAIAPAGIAPPDDDLNGRPHRVSHWQQRVYPEGIEPKPFYRWTSVYNNARVLRPAGMDTLEWGAAALANLNRHYRLRGWDSAEVSEGGMVAFRVRHIVLDGSAPIVRPYNTGHSVHLGQRWLRPEGIYAFRDGFNGNFEKLGIPDVVQRFKRIRPAWGKQADDFGEPRVKNVTPEVKPRGKVQTEWGEASIRTQWREVRAQGDAMTRWGKPRVADSRQWIRQTSRVNTPAIGWHTVRKVGIDPPSLQIIDLRRFEERNGEWTEAEEGYGIAQPGGNRLNVQVPPPDLTKNKIWVEGWGDLRWGQHEVVLMGITVNPGIAHFPFGDATVGYKDRTIAPASIGQQCKDGEAPGRMGSWGLPRLSPHTIYAPTSEEATAQAQNNNPPVGIPNPLGTGERFGTARVGGYNNRIAPVGIPHGGGAVYYAPMAWGTPRVEHRRRYVRPVGMAVTRFGWHSLPCDQHIIFDDASYALPQESWGRASVGFPLDPNRRIGVRGWDSSAFGGHEVQNFHRELPLRGWDSLRMGTSRTPDARYMPQSLHVGFPDWPQMQGWQDDRLGEQAWVSHAIRELRPEGWHEEDFDWTPEFFDRRLRVRRTGDAPVTPQPQPGTVQEIRPQGWECGWRSGLPDVSNKAQHIKAGVICPPTNQVSIAVEVRHA